ncbi:MAG TPA: tRNA glutamyl-Q(34) synthetase GluQRS [Methylomirabilota bacterium]|nr:tRNA glutamyl-Q(34) synthetase GluQRS [Methylomirabilota bacterium]
MPSGSTASPSLYRGRLAPSPTGLLHLGHARTFWTAQEQARQQNGTLILRNEDLDPHRCRPMFLEAMFEDLRWFGFSWNEGPDCGGPYGPYTQSARQPRYRSAFEQLLAGGFLYPCTCSRQDVLRALTAPHAGEDEPVYPGTCRLKSPSSVTTTSPCCWRFRVPDGSQISFIDAHHGPQSFLAGADFGDFVVWRQDGLPSYQLAVTVDDAAMRITEVVRGADLLRSTARQLLLYQALGWQAPAFHHCPLLTDERGVRLAKRHDALSLRQLRESGAAPEDLRRGWTTAFRAG